MFIAMDRKPEDGCEIQNVCDGKSGIMLQLHIVKSSKSLSRELEDTDINLRNDKIVALCHTRLRDLCWSEHVQRHHGVFQGTCNPTTI